MEMIVVSGPDAGRRIALSGAARTIGRNPSSDLALTDSNVSSRHAVVRTLPGGSVELTDLSSTNGTFVNGSRVTAAVTLASGATIQIGQNLLRFEGTAERWTASPSPRSPGTQPIATPPAGSVRDAGPVAAGNVEMVGHQVAGRDLHYHEGFRIRSRMRPGARKLLFVGIAVSCVGFVTSLVSMILVQQEIFGTINSQSDPRDSGAFDFEDEAVLFAVFGLGGLVMFAGLVMIIVSLVMRRERIRVPVVP